jgi:hypothetical protein
VPLGARTSIPHTGKPLRKTQNPSWADVKALLVDQAPSALLELIRDLYRLTAENRDFLHARVGTPAAIGPYLETVEQCVSPDPFGKQPLRLGRARQSISAYRRATGDERGVLELKIRYVECGTHVAADLGGMDDRLCDSLIGMFEDIVTTAARLPAAERDAVYTRLEAVVASAQDLGWGYYDAIDEYLEAARSRSKRLRPGA